MSLSTDVDLNAILNIIAAIGGLVAALVAWCYVRPADKKLSAVEASLQRNNEGVASMRNALLDSSVRLKELRYIKLEESCEAIYRAFTKVQGASAGLLMICASLKDLDEIRMTLHRDGKLDRIQKWLGLFVKDEMLTPIKQDDLSMPEIYVPDRVWKLYNAACSLYSAAIIQMTTLKNGLDLQLVKTKDIYAEVDQVLPGQGEFLTRFGTLGYHSSMSLIKTALLNEIRRTLKNGPITASAVVALNECFEQTAKIPPVPNDLKGVLAEM